MAKGEELNSEDFMKKCPYCAELIQDEAILCRYCGSKIYANTDISDSDKSSTRENVGSVIALIGAILGELYALYIIYSLWGFLGIVAGIMFFPVAIFFAPIYSFIVYGAWVPLVIIYGLIGLGVFINSTSKS